MMLGNDPQYPGYPGYQLLEALGVDLSLLDWAEMVSKTPIFLSINQGGLSPQCLMMRNAHSRMKIISG